MTVTSDVLWTEISFCTVYDKDSQTKRVWVGGDDDGWWKLITMVGSRLLWLRECGGNCGGGAQVVVGARGI